VFVLDEPNSSQNGATNLGFAAFIKPALEVRTCSHLSGLYDGRLSSVHDAIHAADDFHVNGGSLKAVQEYLDRQIPLTLDRLEISYDPTEKSQNNNVPVDEYLRQYFATHDVPRGGYGQPLPLTFSSKSNSKHLQKTLHRDRKQHRWIDVMENWHHDRFQVAVGPALPPCPHLAKFSEGTYEAKNFCIPDLATQESGHSEDDNSDCHIFSIGSNDQWGFEEEILQKLPGCHVHTFDCTLKDNSPLKKPNSAKVHFYPHCVKGETKNGSEIQTDTSKIGDSKSYKTYHDLVQVTGIHQPPKVLKMDIEGFEFDVLSSMLKSSPPTTWPQQIMMEVHFATRMIDLEWLLRTRQTAEMAMFFDLLYNKGGYMPAHVKYIDGCPTCMEILLVRVHCAEEGV
jgi:hypothetical protein